MLVERTEALKNFQNPPMVFVEKLSPLRQS